MSRQSLPLLKSLNLSSHQLKLKTNGPVLLFKTMQRHETFLSSVAVLLARMDVVTWIET